MLVSSFLTSLYILAISPLSDVKIFSHSVGCHFVLWMIFFALQKLLSFMRSHLLICDLSTCTIGVLFKKLSSVPICSRLFPTFSSIRFSISGFILRSLIHLSFVQCDRYEYIYILHADIQLDQHQLLKMLSFFHCIILASLSKVRCS